MSQKLKVVTYWWREQLHPELLEGFIKRHHELPVTELWLVDVEDGKEKLDIIYDPLPANDWDVKQAFRQIV